MVGAVSDLKGDPLGPTRTLRLFRPNNIVAKCAQQPGELHPD
jgi:hypothetical protein